MSSIFNYWISLFSRCITWLFTLEINSDPYISFGSFVIGCFFIGAVVMFFMLLVKKGGS